ncbi:MAG: hypothetical protein LBV71_16090 [Prevotella sp.]|jgi:hypothetical protein|nr:hypothetical protein [Prevotella sp.]
MSDKKTFSITIDGLEKAYNDVLKLSDALKAINSVNASVATTNNEVTSSITSKSKATDELSKAQEKLNAYDAEYQRQLAETKAELSANNKEIQNNIKVTQALATVEAGVTDTYADKQRLLTALGTTIKNMSTTTDAEIAQQNELIAQYKALNDELTATDERMGNNQRKVGAYENATKSLKGQLREMTEELATMIANGVQPTDAAYLDLATRAGELRDAMGDAQGAITKFGSDTRGLDNIISVGQGITSIFGTAQGVMSMFGQSGEQVAQSMEKMMGVMTTLQSLQELQNQLTTQGTVFNKLYTTVLQAMGLAKKADIANTVSQAAATTGASVATGVATTAMKAFRIALVSTGIGALIVGLGLLISNFDSVKKWVVDLVPALGNMGEAFDEVKSVVMGIGQALLEFVIAPFKTLIAVVQGFMENGIDGALAAGEAQVKSSLDVVGNYEKGYHDQSVRNAEAAAKAKAEASATELDNLIKDNEAKLGSDWKYSTEGRKAYANFFDAKKAMYGDDKEKYAEAQREAWKFMAETTKHDADERKKRSDAGKQAAQEAKQRLDDYKKSLEAFTKQTNTLEINNEKTRITNAKDAAEKMVATTKDELTKRNNAITEAYGKQQILQQKLNLDEIAAVDKQYNELIEKAKKAKKTKQDISKIEEERQNLLSELRTKFTLEEINLNKEKNEKIKSSNKDFDDDEKERAENAKKLAQDKVNFEMELIDKQFKTINELKENFTARGGALDLIDVDQTKANLAVIRDELDKQKTSLVKYKDELEKNTTLDPKAKEKALDDINAKIKVNAKDIADNTQQQTQVMTNYWADFSDKVGGYISVVSDSLNSIFETVGSFFDMKLEEAQEKLDEISEKYDETVELQEESNERLLALQEEAKNVSGGRALVVQDEISREMALNKELANQEKQLAKEKEAREKEVAKIQKQQKKAELMGNIVSGLSGGALAVINALQVQPFPLGLALAAVAGAMSAVQVGIMSAQLGKLEKGGLLQGKRHSEGGIPVGNTGIEVEGGEYVTNRNTTSKNLGLLTYINSQDRELGINDFVSYYDDSTGKIMPNPRFRKMFADGGQMDISNISNSSGTNNDAILNALSGINFSPVVSVVDIIDSTAQVTSVRDSAGFS